MPRSPRVSPTRGGTAKQGSFAPSRVALVELTEPISGIGPTDDAGNIYASAHIVATRHGRPVGAVEVDLRGGGISGPTLAVAIRNAVPGESDKDCNDRDSEVPEGPRPRISVVVPTDGKREAALPRCLASLEDLDYLDFEVIVVDNRGPEATAPLPIQSSLAGRLRVVRETRRGTSAARNRGLEESCSDIVAFTDDDVVVDPRWLKAMAGVLARSSHIACVTGLVLPVHVKTQSQAWFEDYVGRRSYEYRTFRLGDSTVSDPLFPYSAGVFGSSNNVAFRKAALQAIGGFDLALGPGTATHSGEDLAVFVSMLYSGATLAYEPAAIVFHEHRQSYADLRRQIFRFGVGLTAMLTSLCFTDWRHLGRIARRIPEGLKRLAFPNANRTGRRGPNYPKALRVGEIVGMCLGPFAYMWARAKVRDLHP